MTANMLIVLSTATTNSHQLVIRDSASHTRTLPVMRYRIDQPSEILIFSAHSRYKSMKVCSMKLGRGVSVPGAVSRDPPFFSPVCTAYQSYCFIASDSRPSAHPS